MVRGAGARGADFPLVVALHARGGDAAAAVAAARGIFGDGPDVIALQAARPCNPLQSNLRSETAYAGFSWYLGETPEQPEAASFGDALAQVELFAFSLSRPFVLFGEGQGAVLAMTLALYAPERLEGVVARGGGLPRIHGWDPPSPSLTDVSFIVSDVDEDAQQAATRTFAARGARVIRSAAEMIGALLLVALTALPSPAASAGPQPASTGAPAIAAEAAEGTCNATCHTSFAPNPDTVGALTVEGVPSQYEAGKTYTLTVKLSHKDGLRWGFQMTAIAMKDGSGAGEFNVTDPATTQVLSAMSGTRSYVEHSYGGTAIGKAGGTSWTFGWKAPATSAGKVAFYAAGNVANADGSNQGDRIYTPSPKPIAESIPAGG